MLRGADWMTSGVANHVERRKKDSARLVWDTKPKRAANPKDIEFQTAEILEEIKKAEL
jgi:adenine-specific DNA-methyltransferase